jgi:hypothetical protein
MNRRDMLRSASVGFALTMLPGPLAMALSGDLRRSTTVIYDERYAEARAFAEHIARPGAVVLPTRGDATGLWYGGSNSSRGQIAGAVAGMTTYPDLVIARSRGRELGLRLAFEERLDRWSAVERPSDLLVWLMLPRGARCEPINPPANA